MTHDKVALFALLLILSCSSAAAIKTEVIRYQDGEVSLQGYLAWDDAIEGRRPGVIVVHEWWGLNDYARRRTEQLAGLGYVAFAVDMYGSEKATEHGEQAKEWMSQITANVDRWQKRARLGIDILRKQNRVDPARIAAIGYCFGGATVMQMAYSGADLTGVVSFHGSLPAASEAQIPHIKAKILVAHGNDDSFIPPERIEKFKAALDKAGADWEMVVYGGARHGFTNPDAGKYGMDGVRYNNQADQRSWRQMEWFLTDIFSGSR